MSSPTKRQKTSASSASPPRPLGLALAAPLQNPSEGNAAMAPPLPSPPTARKRRSSATATSPTLTSPTAPAGDEQSGSATLTPITPTESGKKKGRTNTPWTPEEEQRLKAMRDAGNSWSEIAKAFPSRTEGSVKKHWYKDMHYAEFAEDESIALREAIREYEANKWRVIGQKVGKPAKACEQYAKENFKNM